MFPGRINEYYRVTWVRGGSECSARDITLDGLEKKDCSPDADRFILISRDGKKAPSPAMRPFNLSDIVRDKFNKSSEFAVTYCGLDKNGDWRVNLIGQTDSRPVRTDELASQYQAMPPQAKFKAGDIVVKKGESDRRLRVTKVQSYDSARGCYYVFAQTGSGSHLCGIDQDNYEPAPPLKPRFAVGDFVQLESGIENGGIFRVQEVLTESMTACYSLLSLDSSMRMGYFQEHNMKPVNVEGITNPVTFFVVSGIGYPQAEAMGKWVKNYVDGRLVDLNNKVSMVKELLK
jgi:hypothetical protein